MHRVLPALAILAALAAHSSAATTAPETPGAEKRTKQQRVEAALEARIQAAFVNNEAAIQAFNQHINKTLTKDSQRYAARVTAVELMEALRRGEVVPDRKAARSQLDGLIEQKAANIVNVIQSPPARVEQTGNLVQPPSEGPVTPGRSGRQDIAPNEIAQVAREAMAQGVKASQPTPMVQTPIDVPPMVAPGLPNTTALPPASGAPTTGSRTPPTGESVPTPEELLGRWFVDRNPRDGVAREILARNAWRRADYQTVYEETRNAIANGRVGPANFLMRGLAAEHLGDYEQANRDAQVTLQFDPANRRARDLLHMTEGKASAVRLAEAQAPWAASARDDEGPGGPSGQAGSGPQPSAAL
ncbi:MAG: hypothetical protein HY553_05325, partial [Elusimicrobia bacterium]|nr:hypothetical protein [Elusimicrobiota bacterium]